MTPPNRFQLLRLTGWALLIAFGGFLIPTPNGGWLIGVSLVSFGFGGLTNVLADARRGGMR